jgi:hypothetical protein
MSDYRSASDREPITPDREPIEGSTRVEYEQVGIHNEAETVRRDRIRWGPIWAGIVTTVGAYLILMLILVAVGAIEPADTGTDVALWSGLAALIAFFIGGLATGATSMWQGVDDGIIHGVVMWFAALVLLIALAAFGGGVALGAIDVTDAFDDVTTEDEVDLDEVGDTAQEGARNALIAIVLALAASGAGGAAGSKLWPKDDVVVDVPVARRDS